MLEQEDAFQFYFQGMTMYHDTFCFVEPCFGLRSRLLRYDPPSSSYRSYCRFIPIRGNDVQYSNCGDSRRSFALFTSKWESSSLAFVLSDPKGNGDPAIYNNFLASLEKLRRL
ncbi:hypothetical protein OPV22_002688 [Ensete ventricosum]|uniref:Uncharacterized protein n=1 Tax=Ensete ventricosum TaxID=4639 RepID=A0AAV8RYN4_ENSVE|nr:hypothetical protein OPV22_002688 [Ensete ventricosum]